MDYAKLLQTIIESIFTCIIFFVIARPLCHTFWKVLFTVIFTGLYVVGFAILYEIPLIPTIVAIVVLSSIIMNFLDHRPILDGNYCAVLFLSHVVERFGTLLSGIVAYFIMGVGSYSPDDNKVFVVLVWALCQILFTLFILNLKLFKEGIRKWLGKGFNRFIILSSWLILCSVTFLGNLIYKDSRIQLQVSLIIGLSILVSLLWLADEIKKRQERHKLEEANRQLSAEVHKSKEFLPSIHKVIQKQAAGAVPRGVQTELARMAQEQELETRCALLEYDPVSATGLYLLDEQLADYRREAIDKDVDLFISVQDPVAPLVENGVITQIRLQRLIGDLMRNAFNAIDRRPSGPRGQILLLLGLTADGCYEIDICDNGAPFPAWVLENLGVRGTTTGGTGNGMADIFDTLALCKASFTLQKESEGQLYTKHITISFDGTGRLAIDH
ncbi:Uncharacterised protein [Anaerotruncus sp. 2789STDY5834896]|uniref:Sensor histidine kinase NatK C-terminal domain-containing protein n=1 Tax=uncultured Anaerotruncus sp. TaxID=905011 RepID=A0A1C6JA60_9FIRM|nr:Uncharacterised protein [uncultured Anaerotruncus sp.]